MIKICVQCGKEFTPRRGYEDIQKYCSPECKKKYLSHMDYLRSIVKPIAPTAAKPTAVKPTTDKSFGQAKCLYCRKHFKRSFLNEKFCSDECRLEFFQSSPLQPHLLRRR